MLGSIRPATRLVQELPGASVSPAPRSLMAAPAVAALLLAAILAPAASFAEDSSGVPPYVPFWKSRNAEVLEKVSERGRVEMGERRQLVEVLAANRSALDRAVELSRGSALEKLSTAPDYKVLREAGRALVARGIMRASSNDREGALDDWFAVLWLGRATAHGPGGKPSLLDGMVGYALEAEGVRALSRLANEKPLAGGEAKRIRAALEARARDGMPAIAQMIENDGAAVVDLLTKGDEKSLTETWKEARLLGNLSRTERARVLREVAPHVKRRFEALARAAATGQSAVPQATEVALSGMAATAYKQVLDLATPDAAKAQMKIQAYEQDVARLSQLLKPASR